VAVILSGSSCRSKKQQVTAVLKTAPDKHAVKNRPSQGAGTSKQPSNVQQALGVTNKEVGRSRLYTFINEWYGVPYRYGGCQKSGVDCSCFVSILSEKVYGKKIPRSTTEMFSACDQLSISEAREGDLLFFRISGSKVSHVAVYLRKDLFVHASTSSGVMISSLKEAYFKKYFFSAGRMRSS
jgi:murein DD-endopeptidase / murein LD-carboxypeptidase